MDDKTLFAKNIQNIGMALSGPILTLTKRNPKFGVGYHLSDKDVERDDATIYLSLMDGPSATGKVIKTLTAQSTKSFDCAYIADIVEQFETLLFDLQDEK